MKGVNSGLSLCSGTVVYLLPDSREEVMVVLREVIVTKSELSLDVSIEL